MLHPKELGLEKTRPLRRVEFEQLAMAGCFEDERVELLYGAVVEMSPPDPRHDWAIERLNVLFVTGLVGRARVRINMSFAASEYSEPVPDVVLAPPGESRIEHPSQAWLIVEVANTSLRKDRNVKAQLYAECSVPEYWIVNVNGRTVERFSDPHDGVYRSCVSLGVNERIAPLRFPEVSIAISEIV